MGPSFRRYVDQADYRKPEVAMDFRGESCTGLLISLVRTCEFPSELRQEYSHRLCLNCGSWGS
jgi:hypothetical protein